MIKLKEKRNRYIEIATKQSKGITLIALIVTIVVMIVVAGVSINMTVGENGIFTKAVKAKEMQEAAEIKERLELKQLDARLALGGENMTLENYLKYLVDQGMIDESDIEDTVDSNVKTILVDDKYIYSVIKNDDGSITLEYEGKAGKLLPKIKNIEVKPTTNSITVKVDPTRVDGGEYRFYIKDVASGEDYKNKQTNKTGEYTFTGLEQNKEFKVKVEVENKNGITEKETNVIRTVTVAELTQADLEFTYNPNEWTKDKIVVTVNAKIELPEGYTLQTSKDMTNWENTITQEFTENGYMYVRLYDGTNGGSYAVGEVTKIDKDAPTITISSSNVDSNRFTLNATVQDTASGLQKIEWYYKKSTDTKYTKLEDSFSGETASLTKTKEISSIPYAETYNAFARVYDVTTNSKDSNVINVALTTPVAQIGNVGYSSLQKAVNAVPDNNTQTTINMLSNITESDTKIAENQNIKLDIKSKTITGRINNNGTIAIENGTINNPEQHALYNYGTMNLTNVTVSSSNDSVATISNKGTLNVKEGTTITSTITNCIYTFKTTNIYGGTMNSTEGHTLAGTKATYNIYEGSIYSTKKSAIAPTESSTVNIYGGTIYANISAIVPTKSSKVNVYGGTIYSKNGNGINVNNTVTVTIEDGHLYSEENGHGVWVASGGNAVIKGGTLQCKKTISQEALDIDSGGAATVLGGTIEHLDGGKAIICDGTITINGSSVLIQNSASTYPTVKIGSGATCTFTKGTIKNKTSGGTCYYDENDTTSRKTGTWTK